MHQRRRNRIDQMEKGGKERKSLHDLPPCHLIT